MQNQKSTKKEVDSAKEELRQRILAKADETKGEQFTIFPDGNMGAVNQIEEILKSGLPIDNPEKKYNLYYKGIERTLKNHLPKGKEFAKARSYVREEKCVFLTRGKRLNEQGIRNMDSRMGYIEDADKMLKLIMKWVSKNGTMVELHNEIRDLNISLGYGKRIVY